MGTHGPCFSLIIAASYLDRTTLAVTLSQSFHRSAAAPSGGKPSYTILHVASTGCHAALNP